MGADIGQMLGMGVLCWLAERLLPEGESGLWGRRALELVLFCLCMGSILGGM